MRGYKLIGENNSSITRDNFEHINEIIKEVFPEVAMEKRDMGRAIRETYGLNGSTFHIYYGLKETQIFIPLEENLIKTKLESKTKLRLEELN